MLLNRFPAGSVPLAQHPANRLIAQVGNPVGGNLPELGVKNLEGDVSVVADASQVIENRVDLKIPFARQDPVPIAGQLAGGAAQVADLDPGQILAGEVGQVLELAGPGVIMEQVQTHAGVLEPHWAIRASAVSRQAQKPEDLWNSSAIRTSKSPASSAASPSMAAARR